MDIRAESYSIITNKNKIIMGFAISFMAMFLAMNLYRWQVSHIYNSLELSASIFFLCFLISRVTSHFHYTLQKTKLTINSQNLWIKKSYEVPYKSIVGIFPYQPGLMDITKYRRTYRLHSALDNRPIWTIAYTCEKDNGKIEDRRIYFKADENFIKCLKIQLPNKIHANCNRH